MKNLNISRSLFIIAVTLGICVAYAGIEPSVIDGKTFVGNCEKCNWSDFYTCDTSEGAQGQCESPYCDAGGDGSGTVNGPYTYCDGALYCDETQGTTCSVGNNCIVEW
jgi:hypothetical protein